MISTGLRLARDFLTGTRAPELLSLHKCFLNKWIVSCSLDWYKKTGSLKHRQKSFYQFFVAKCKGVVFKKGSETVVVVYAFSVVYTSLLNASTLVTPTPSEQCLKKETSSE